MPGVFLKVWEPLGTTWLFILPLVSSRSFHMIVYWVIGFPGTFPNRPTCGGVLMNLKYCEICGKPSVRLISVYPVCDSSECLALLYSCYLKDRGV